MRNGGIGVSKVESIRHDLDIEDFGELNSDAMRRLISMTGKGKVSVEELGEIASMVPHFSSMAVASLRSIADATVAAKASQEAALATMREAIASIERIASHANADNQTLIYSMDKIVEIAKSLENMNASNNGVFMESIKSFAKFSVYCLMVAGTVYTAINSKDKA